ncbi:hypothetical protein [Clostridium vitabionis]|uniref:hypothetical protein n=1 Tax=Clostridium vitabionis TaxID=2784388 RepID=UPI00188AB365|nr:hypothetical protein [Clostridium vitabionis]
MEKAGEIMAWASLEQMKLYDEVIAWRNANSGVPESKMPMDVKHKLDRVRELAKAEQKRLYDNNEQ